MSDGEDQGQPGLGELGRGLNGLRADLRQLSDKVDRLPQAFAEQAVSRERYEADERRRKIEHDSLQKQVDDIDEWKKHVESSLEAKVSRKTAWLVISAILSVAAVLATIAAVAAGALQ